MRLYVFPRPFVSIFLTLALVCSLQSIYAQDLAAGKSLFQTNCASCHRVDAQLVGPKMGGVDAKYADQKEWLYKWIRNSAGLIKSGDPQAVALYNQYGQQAMTAFPALSNEDIDNILAWATAEEIVKNTPQDPPPGTLVGGAPTDPLDNPTIYYTLALLVGALVLISLLLVLITATLVVAVRAKENNEEFEFKNVWAIATNFIKNKFVITTIVVIALVGGATKWIEYARGISLQQGYMPEQPIDFSHKLHAGTYEIDCKYCHTGTIKSKSAWIPSVNICMNCHKAIKKGPTGKTEEIQKIYDAIGFDPSTGQYIEGYEQKAVKWVRIHNLPDHAYFNHAQHVVVGGLECQTCHGPVQEMEVVYQYSTLGMGWCINCHREENVKELGAPNSEGLTVEDLGGLNCARCHY